MRVLSPIIQGVALAVLNIRQQLAFRNAIGGKFVGDENVRHILQALQQPPEETLCRSGVVLPFVSSRFETRPPFRVQLWL